MKRYLLLCSLPALMLAASCTETDTETYTEKQTIRFVELEYGIADTQKQESNSDEERSGTNARGNTLKISESTDTIPARQGIQFGVRYMLESNLDPSVELRQVWTFPDSVHDEEGNVYIEDAYKLNRVPNEESSASYSLDYPYELKKGKWQLAIYYKKRLLYRKIFVLI